jgi:hypothetical protein
MKKYNEEYFTVRERRTHRKICDCGDFEDARMMMHLDGPNREIVKNKTLMSPVIDIEMPKQLPTREVVVNTTDGVSGFGGSLEVEESMGFGKQLPQIKLPEGQQEPVIV